MVRKYIAPALFAALGVAIAVPALAAGPAGAAAPAPPAVNARGVAVTDGLTGRLLYGRSEDVRLPIASTTKIMTAVGVLERVRDLDREFVVPAAVEDIPFGAVGLRPGERYTCDELLWALLIESANDAALTLAVGVAGSEPDFVRLMNRKARSLRLKDLHFENPHGIDETGHYGSAADLCRLGTYAMADARFRGYVDQQTALFQLHSETSPMVLESHNTLVRDHWWANGVKTGETAEAGFCIVASGAPNGAEIFVTLLGAFSRAQREKDAVALFEWAAPQYSWWASPGEGETAAAGFAPGGRHMVDLRVLGGPVQTSLAPGVDVRLGLDRGAGRHLPTGPALQLVFATWYADETLLGTRLLRGEVSAPSPGAPSASASIMDP